jgi:hypothetical protein
VPDTIDLNSGKVGVLDASGSATLEIGPDRGRTNWRVTTILLKSSRPGLAPIPRAEVYLDAMDAGSRKGLTYDGSFASGACDILVTRGQHLICHWTGGQAGDSVEFTVNGEQW